MAVLICSPSWNGRIPPNLNVASHVPVFAGYTDFLHHEAHQPVIDDLEADLTIRDSLDYDGKIGQTPSGKHEQR